MPVFIGKGRLLASIEDEYVKLFLFKQAEKRGGSYVIFVIKSYPVDKGRMYEPGVFEYATADDLCDYLYGGLKESIHGFGRERAILHIASDFDKDIKSWLLKHSC